MKTEASRLSVPSEPVARAPMVGRRRRSREGGFTLLELMAVAAVLGILAMQASYSATVEQKRAKRTEVIYGLDSLDTAQRLYFEEYGRYAGNFEELTFSIDGAVLLSPTTLQGRRYTYTLSQPWGDQSYHVAATGQIDSDPFPDIRILEAGRQ